MAMLPMLWDELSGENQQTMNRLSAQAIDELYTACKRDAQDIADAARLAVRALLYEVTTTPKPGLVDRRNSGSHKDMDVFTFMDSAAALYPYFEACARTGRETAEQPAPETFAALRPLGCEAEGEMLDATGGVNTHKGAVFSVGIVCAALGRLDRSLWAEAARVLAEVSAMTAGLTEKDFAGVTAENAATVGQKLYIQYGIAGVRGQVEAGLPAVLNVGLPVLEAGLAKGYDFDRVGGGDSFASGLIYGLMTEGDPRYAVNCGIAHGALAMTTPGDTSMASKREVEAVMNGAGARVQR